MAIFDLFWKREAQRQNQGQEDVFQYMELPAKFRVQVIHIWSRALGRCCAGFRPDIDSGHPPTNWWNQIHQVMLEEKGLFRLSNQPGSAFDQCCAYLLSEQTATEDAIDLIEVAFKAVNMLARRLEKYERTHYGICDPDNAIQDLNGRFRENGIGYEFAGGEIIRVDSRLLHAEAVKPALRLLHGGGKAFSGPLQEFHAAHARYRKGEHKEAVADALKSFESTLKAICTLRRWTFDPQKDAAQKLIDIVFSNGLVPSYLQNQFTSLRTVLESGVPTARNRTSGYGQGPEPIELPGHFVGYVLHMAASNIVFLIESHQANEVNSAETILHRPSCWVTCIASANGLK
jgi:hypothetical protein